jgi:hypothetical protein
MAHTSPGPVAHISRSPYLPSFGRCRAFAGCPTQAGFACVGPLTLTGSPKANVPASRPYFTSYRATIPASM